MAHDLVYAKAQEIGADLLAVTEPNKKMMTKSGWITDIRLDAAIYVMNKSCGLTSTRSHDGYVQANFEDVVLLVGYISPNTMWESPQTDDRREYWENWMAELDLICHNDRSATFIRGNTESHIDITCSSTKLANKITEWKTLDATLFTFHKMISFEINSKACKKKESQILYRWTKQSFGF